MAIYRNPFKPTQPKTPKPIPKSVTPSIDTFKISSRFYYMRMSPEDRVWYRKLYNSWVGGSTIAKFEMPFNDFKTPSGMPFLNLCLAVNEDNPHLFHIEYTQFNYKQQGKLIEISTKNVYTASEFQQVYDRLHLRVNEILSKAGQYQSKYDQLRYLHDYLASTITYDYGKSDDRSQREVHTIVGALLNRHCVCDGYARTLRLLCDKLHISCIVVPGDGITPKGSEAHAWNMVKLDDRVYHMDITWDSNLTEGGYLLKDFNYLRNDEFMSQKHSWLKAEFPKCPVDYPRREPLIDDVMKLEQELRLHLVKHHKRFLLRLGGPYENYDVFHKAYRAFQNKYKELFPVQGHFVYKTYDYYHYVEFIYQSNNKH